MSSSTVALPLPATSETLRHGVEQTGTRPAPAEIAKHAEHMEGSNTTRERSPDNGDDLQQITGVGPAIAKALNNLGIHRYIDLANLTSDSLADLLKAESLSISPKRIERDDWIGQAQAMSKSANTERASANEEVAEEKGSQHHSRKKEWEEHAEFSVFFDRATKEGEQVWQTRVYDNKTGDEEPLPGIDTNLWVSWILERAELPITVGATGFETQVRPPSAPKTPYDAAIRILDVQVSEIEAPIGVWTKKLSAGVQFQLSGPDAETLTADRIQYRIEVYSVNTESRVTNLVASKQSQFQPNELDYASQLAFLVPSVGRYELHTLILLLPPAAITMSHRGPVIKVVP